MCNAENMERITLIGDPNDITNWRPITLFNTDYTIIVNRIKPVVENIIYSDQKVYLKSSRSLRI